MSTTLLAERANRVSARPGFTLGELLAVLVVIVLLVGLVEPSLEVTRERSKYTTCLDRLQAIGNATAIYTAEDPEGMALPVHHLWSDQDPDVPSFIGAYEWGGKSGTGAPGWVAGPGGDYAYLTSKYGTMAGFGPGTRPLNAILYPHGFRNNLEPQLDRVGATKDTEVRLDAYNCPADDGPPGGGHCPDWLDNPQRSSFDHFGTSYAANMFMVAGAAGGEMSSNSPYLRPATRVPAPARTINYEENIGRWAWASQREMNACLNALGSEGIDPGPTKAIRGWHGKNWTYNRVFGDAHAELQRVFIEGTEDADGYSEHYRNELVYPDDPDTQQRFVCIIVRGDGWQKDTLPDAPIPTGLLWSGNGRPSYENCVWSD